MLAKSALLTLTPLGYLPVSSLLCTRSPVLVVVAAMRLTITSWLTRGLPRQFCVMKENSRCSILFHLLVPGGRWQTVIVRPSSLARFCSSRFHNLTRARLPPPQSGDQQGCRVGIATLPALSRYAGLADPSE